MILTLGVEPSKHKTFYNICTMFDQRRIVVWKK